MDIKQCNKQLFQSAIDKWGVELQIDMMIEECSELITALSHMRRRRITTGEVLEELADVEIMLAQMNLIFDSASIETIKLRKLKRLAKRIACN